MNLGLAIAYYKQKDNLPLVAWGIEQNREFVDHVVICSDDILEVGEMSTFKEKMDELGIECDVLSHRHGGNGVNRCLNKAIDYLRTDLITVLAADVVLPPGCLEELARYAPNMKLNTLLSGPCDTIKPLTLDELAAGQITLREDLTHTRVTSDNLFYSLRPWLHTRGVNNTFRRDAFDKVRYDEAYEGRGYKDWDFVLRWARTHGTSSIAVQPRSRRWHIHDWESSPRPNSELAGFRFADRLAEYFGHRYQLFGAHYCDPLAVNVGPVRGALCDVNLDSQSPAWIRPATAHYIATDLARALDPVGHLQLLASRLRPGGYIVARNDRGIHLYDFHGLDVEPGPEPNSNIYLKEDDE